MPQSNTGNWRVKDIPYGKGSLHGQTLEASVRHWRRAMKINEAENYKCNLTTSLLEKHHKAVENRKERTMESIRHSLEEMDAYREVLQSYRALNFRTMQRGFRAKPCGTPRCLLRYKLERRIYDCGFSVDTLKTGSDANYGSQQAGSEASSRPRTPSGGGQTAQRVLDPAKSHQPELVG
ncbi:hypothetical protein LSH36_3g16004 [Paralvinella palmiformis]|uniref:Uncharacterized protein n=1 Tax=Paralvinella palmiformis TaxID=53620 RepID=A0AAD9NJ12_9ANNE|nr:hypothetical protein LSH36_3g16004 [Paralvinella palmiformis]